MYNIVFFLEIHRQRGLNFFFGQQFHICSLKYAIFLYHQKDGRRYVRYYARTRMALHYWTQPTVWYSWADGGCVGLYHYYYNGNLTYTYIMVTIWTYYIYLCAYRVTHFCLFPVDFCIQIFHYVHVNSYFSQLNNVFEIILVFWKEFILITCLAVHLCFPWRLTFPNGISTNIIILLLYVTMIMVFP